MPASFGWTGAGARWNYHHGCGFAQETLGSQKGDVAEGICKGEGAQIDCGM